MEAHDIPIIIQGGMGAAVSGWKLARTVSLHGQLGVVSGTALNLVLARRLQLGDHDGHLRRALEAFPYPDIAQRVLQRYFVPGGKAQDAPFKSIPMLSVEPARAVVELIVVANFVEVYLAREGQDGFVGINYLEKIQTPILPSLYGAMLAGVDYVLIGAGIPRAIPGILDGLSRGEPVQLSLNVQGADRGEEFLMRFDPGSFVKDAVPYLHRPKFLAIVSSATLATMLAKRASGFVDGFIVEGPTAGGHNAPPRGAMQLNDRGEPVYTARDVPDLEAFRNIGRPFWLAGSYGNPERVTKALEAGAAGVQVGTAFAYCEESGLRPDIKRQVLQMVRMGNADVVTDPRASPTGFPFKVLSLKGSLSEYDIYNNRERCCDLGFLRQAYKQPDGAIGWRCPGEQLDQYLRKGGEIADTDRRKCICNALLANVGLGQVRENGEPERPIVTCGDDINNILRFLPSPDSDSYTARDVVAHLLSQVEKSSRILN
jgi:nitronate monooxygenase